ncbi:unnamed protein product [Zymoseptoria tritici ST99CH_3D1]|nr:unnamed protein product [Zymoseptoria tritici ST99CH_3D1]
MYAFLATAAAAFEPYELRTVQDAKRTTVWTEWKDAISEEVKSLRKNKTWQLKKRSQISSKANILPGRWVFKLKRGPNGKILKYKARWVVKGYRQEEGSDYTETFASVVKPMSYKAIFAIAAALDYEIEQMDVKTAFLYGLIKETVYVEQPHEFEEGDDVCLLKKSLYGLKQSPRTYVFIRGNTFIAVYVDDLLIVGLRKKEVSEIKSQLAKRFEMSDLGPCAYYLGMTVRRDRVNRKIFLSQQAYIEKFLRQHNMWEQKVRTTPIDSSAKIQPAEEGYIAPDELRTKYQSAVGSLMYAMLGTRPDIAYSVSVVSRFCANPTEEHWKLVERIMAYLRHTIQFELVYHGDLQLLSGYTDADWAGDIETRRSTSGWVFSLGSGAISWSSKRQTRVALSTVEAEYIGETQAAKEAIWLKSLLDQILPDSEKGPQATIIHCDN